MPDDMLSDFVEATATKFGIPGVAVGVWANGQEVYACHGVTGVDNPLPVDPDTMYVLGSVSKTPTATAIMRLVAEGKIELDAPVRRYVPELVLSDEQAAAEMTVFQLLNHTSGLGWRLAVDTGDGDDALAGYVEKMVDLEVIAPPGTRASYSQSGYNLLGRIIEKVTGLTFERAIASLIFEPLGMAHSFYLSRDILTRRYAVGHNTGEDAALSVARTLNDTRGNNPGGGLVSSVSDQLRWARFHLGDGRADSGERVLPAEVLHRMREQTVELRGSSFGDAFGICWFLRDVDGVRLVGHAGSANGQFAELLIVPDRNFAVVSVSNADPGGIPFNRAVLRWALEHYLGLIDKDPEPIPYDEARAREIVGRYETDILIVSIASSGAGLTAEAFIKPEIRAASEVELPADMPPGDLGLLAGDGDEFIITSGAMQGLRGYFSRDESGTIVGADLAGRIHTRVPTGSQ